MKSKGVFSFTIGDSRTAACTSVVFSIHGLCSFLHCLISRHFPQPSKLSNSLLLKSHLPIITRPHANRECPLELCHKVSSPSRKSFTIQQGHDKGTRTYLQPGQSTPQCISRCGTGAEQLRKSSRLRSKQK